MSSLGSPFSPFSPKGHEHRCPLLASEGPPFPELPTESQQGSGKGGGGIEVGGLLGFRVESLGFRV